ncbi:MAG: TfoX/Sxy family protein [Anaerolineae bacterium]|nr:TfoX/Sxy family protein [Anaerolineae bacterium]
MVASKYRQIQSQFEAWVGQIPDIQPDLIYKDMFGGVLIYTAGKPFAVFIDDYVALKLPDEQRAEILKEAAANDPGYNPDTPVSKNYVKLPPSIVSADEKVTYWIEDSIRYVQTLMPAKKKKRKN